VTVFVLTYSPASNWLLAMKYYAWLDHQNKVVFQSASLKMPGMVNTALNINMHRSDSKIKTTIDQQAKQTSN